jgi:hypothetical protein
MVGREPMAAALASRPNANPGCLSSSGAVYIRPRREAIKYRSAVVPKTAENPPPYVPQRPYLMSRPSNSRRGMNRPANGRRLLVASSAPEFAGFRPRLFS